MLIKIKVLWLQTWNKFWNMYFKLNFANQQKAWYCPKCQLRPSCTHMTINVDQVFCFLRSFLHSICCTWSTAIDIYLGAISLDVGNYVMPQLLVSSSLHQLHFLMFHSSIILQPFFIIFLRNHISQLLKRLFHALCRMSTSSLHTLSVQA